MPLEALVSAQYSLHRCDKSNSASVALAAKVYSAYAAFEGVDKGYIRELEVFQRIQDVAEDSYLPFLKDHFYHATTQGKHFCLVMPVLCDSVDDWRLSMPGKVLGVQNAKAVVALALEGLIALHKKGIIHTGKCQLQ